MRPFFRKLLIGVSIVTCSVVFITSNVTYAAELVKKNDDDVSKIQADVGYVKISDLPSNDDKISDIRKKALQEGASTLGANGALAWRSNEINKSLNDEASYLDKVFNFNQLILNNNVLPPVLVESDGELNVDSDTSLRLDSKTYKIEAPAKFVSTPPTWRNYLLMNYKKPELPSKTLLPTTQAEAKLWNSYLEDGWKQGLTQANDIFNTNLSRMKRDFLGMVLYKKLLAQNMVSAPYVAKADLGVTGDKNQIRVDDKVLKITSGSELETDASKWTPAFTK